MKKLIALVIVSLIIFSALPLGVFAGDEPEDWEVYENYLFYNNDNLEKTEGYLIGDVKIFVSDYFMEEYRNPEWDDIENDNDMPSMLKSDFPEIADKILEIEKTENYYSNILHFKTEQEKWTNPYTKEAIDEFIDILRYLKSSNLVRDIVLTKMNLKDGEIDPKFEDYNKYMYYGDHKESGYIIDAIFIELEDEYFNKGLRVEPALFGKYKDSIKGIENYPLLDPNDWFVLLNNENGEHFTDEMLDEFIAELKYYAKLPYIKTLFPNYAVTAYPDTEQETVVDPEPKGDAPTEKDALHNPQTGDELFVLVSVAAVAAGAGVSGFVMKKKKERD